MAWDVDIKSAPKPVKFALESNKARTMRDLVDQHGGKISSAKLKQLGYNLSDLKLSHLVDPQGNISSEKLQAHIDSMPRHEYNVVEGEHGYDLSNLPKDKANKEALNTFLQRHTPERSKISMFELTPHMEQQLKQQGLWDTFKKFQGYSKQSGHPATEKGFGWVRHTEADDGIHIDEVQSDFPQSLQHLIDHQIKNLKAIKNWDPKTTQYAKKYHPQGHLINQVRQVPEERIANMGEQFAGHFNDEHLKAIHKILFKDQKPNQMLHEAFLQKLRDEGKINKNIHIWTPESKGRIALTSQTDSIPGHMHETYGKIPTRIGYKPSTYGELATQSNPELSNMTTQKMNLTKIEKLKVLREKLKDLRKMGLKGDWKKEGYKIVYKGFDENHQNSAGLVGHVVEAVHPVYGKVAEAVFGYHPKGGLAVSSFVHKDHQRKGLATAMYVAAENETGEKINSDVYQSPDAQSLWSQPDRTFGKSEFLLFTESLRKAAIVPFDAKEHHGKKVFIYYNLHNNLWSVRHNGKVLGHTKNISIDNPVFKVSEAGRQRVLRDKAKNVHAGVQGIVNSIPQDPSPEGKIRVSYNPYKAPTFVDSATANPVYSAKTAHLSIEERLVGDKFARIPHVHASGPEAIKPIDKLKSLASPKPLSGDTVKKREDLSRSMTPEEKLRSMVGLTSKLQKDETPLESPLGQTKSGKPIYLKHDHPAHAEYTLDDHQDAHDLLQNKLESTAQQWKVSGDRNLSRQMNMMRIHQDKHLFKINLANKQSASQAAEQQARTPNKFVLVSQHHNATKNGQPNPVSDLKNINDLNTLEQYHGRRQHEFISEPIRRHGYSTHAVDLKTGALKFLHADFDTSDQGKVR